MSGTELFGPSYQGTATKTTSTSSAATAMVGKGIQVRIYNTSSADLVYFEFGDSTVVAAVANGFPIGPGQQVGITIAESATHFATIASANTPVVYVTRGNGT